MIAVDTSALVAVLLDEPKASECRAAMSRDPSLQISAMTIAEALIVATGRRVAGEMAELIESLEFEILPVSGETARRVGEIYARWGKGYHRASLNLGDCFSYDLAAYRDCPLLFIGNDFAQTDIASVL